MTGQEPEQTPASTPGAQWAKDMLTIHAINFVMQCGVGRGADRCPMAATTSIQCLSCRWVLGKFYCDYHASRVLALPKAQASHGQCRGSGAEMLEASGLAEAGWFSWER